VTSVTARITHRQRPGAGAGRVAPAGGRAVACSWPSLGGFFDLGLGGARPERCHARPWLAGRWQSPANAHTQNGTRPGGFPGADGSTVARRARSSPRSVTPQHAAW